MTTYNTNLAAEFYVLSMLYRIGADATLTLGNKKAVDIIVANESRRLITIDVKGLAGRYDWITQPFFCKYELDVSIALYKTNDLPVQ